MRIQHNLKCSYYNNLPSEFLWKFSFTSDLASNGLGQCHKIVREKQEGGEERQRRFKDKGYNRRPVNQRWKTLTSPVMGL